MRLRKQLVFLSLLSLSLPWAGCQYIKEMSSALQQGQSAALQATAQAVAARLGAEPALLHSPHQSAQANDTNQILYAHPLDNLPSNPMIVDGYIDDWRGLNIPAQVFNLTDATPDDFSVAIRHASRQQQLYAFVEVLDTDIQYHRPSSEALASGDHLILSRGLKDGGSIDYTLATSAQGSVSAFYIDAQGRRRQQHQIEGAWLESEQGYNVELKLPLAFADYGFGLQAINKNDSSQVALGTHHRNTQDTNASAALTYPRQNLTAALSVFAQPGLKLQVLDQHGWLLAQAGDLNTAVNKQTNNSDGEVNTPPWLMLHIYRAALASRALPDFPPQNFGKPSGADIESALNGQNNNQWYHFQGVQLARSNAVIHPADNLTGPSHARVVIAEQTSEHLLALTGGAFTRLLQYSFITTFFVSITLLIYASWLSWRIRKLGRAAAAAVAEDGQLQTLSAQWPSLNAKDEIGDLSRHYRDLLLRLGGHTDYLKTLAGKLSHELRTPLAVVRSSLDNLAHEPLTPQARIYWDRACDGGERLSKLITAMSAASRVESSIQAAEREHFDFAELVKQLINAYKDVYPQQLVLEIVDGDYDFYGAPELIVQLLDKLSDNAADFCPEHGVIRYRLERQDQNIQLSVSNEGPLLPISMREQLFDSLVSVRANTGKNADNAPHMGLGLHIVRLISSFHKGRVSAHNLEDESGVCFSVVLPCAHLA